MKKNVLPLAIISLLAALTAPGHATPAPWLLNQKVTVNDVAATISIPAGETDFMILVKFQSQKFPVGCLSAYRDLQYELLDAKGAIVPVSQRTLQHPPPEQSVFNHVIKGSTGHPCSENAPMGVWNVRAQFSALYPNLPQGRYTLQITFAPRGTGRQANFTPVKISIAR